MTAKVRSKVIDRDKGYKALLAMIDRIATDRPSVAVGCVGKIATQPHKAAPHRGRRRSSGETVVQIGAKHELGLGVPQRAFIGPTIDAKESEYRKIITKSFKATVMYYTARKMPWDANRSVALKRLGLLVQGDIKKRITAGISPPLSPVTLRIKGSGKTTPLIDTGHLLSSISFEVRSKTR
jgi:hypothetical protein